MCDEPCRSKLPQFTAFGIETGKPEPTVSYEPFDVRVALHDARQTIPGALHDDRETRGLVDLDHLPRKPGAQVALRTIHNAEERRDVVRQLRATAVSCGVDVAEVVLEADSRDDGHHRSHGARQDRTIIVLRRIVRDEKRPSIEEQSTRPAPPAD